jgi:hypothetical protein
VKYYFFILIWLEYYLEWIKRRFAHSQLDFPIGRQLGRGNPKEGMGEPKV